MSELENKIFKMYFKYESRLSSDGSDLKTEKDEKLSEYLKGSIYRTSKILDDLRVLINVIIK